ncbi:MAG TPA: ATP-dependent Clp protease ATP-binding subunit ClpC [Lachnospiraceae bacterium]|nr:ATP-dependent Clp protease ATP-binding subunit ClpC [Lachnospiraceae bacterium]
MGLEYTAKSKKVLDTARKISRSYKHGYIGSEHLLLAFMVEGNSVVSEVLKKNEVSRDTIKDLIEKQISPGGDVLVMDRDGYTPKFLEILDMADEIAVSMDDDKIGTEHLLIAIIRDGDNLAVRILNTLGVNLQKLYVDILMAIGEDVNKYKDQIQNSRQGQRGMPGNQLLIDKYSRDLTELAAAGKLDPVIGRETEIQRIIQTLSRRTKNNPCLVGEPGVGKTAIVEGLARRIVEGAVPRTVQGKRLLTLDMASMVAGTKYRGEFEERIKKVINEVIENKNIILFVDELHTLIGAGGAEGSLDASNILKPSLSRGEVQLIGATTHDEYRKYIEKDAALERRFQPINVEAPSVEDSIKILKGIRNGYEKHHGVVITDEAVEACVKLSDRYISDRFLPDKAIDLMDEAAAKLRIVGLKSPAGLEELKDRLERIEEEKENALRQDDLPHFASLKSEQEKLQKEYEKKKKKYIAKTEELSTVGPDIIADIVSEWTKIPVKKLAEGETAKLNRMEKTLKARVIGQDEAVSAVVRAIKRGRVGLKEKNRPIGSFLFLGPTGVGKTELSKALTEVLFGTENAMIRVDMSEYMEKHTVSKMIGSPPGYVGFEEGGQLSEKVRRNPYSVVLFDEIEKAHPDVFNILLQVLDEGTITDSNGRKVSFKNCVIIMTSNAGANRIIDPKHLGFVTEVNEKADHNKMKEGVMDEVKKIFKPEFINRIDEIIVFRSLDQENMKKIVTLLTGQLAGRLKEEMNVTLTVADSVKKHIALKGADKKFGARPLKRAIQTMLEDKLAEAVLEGRIKENDRVRVTMKKGEIEILSQDAG